MTALGGRLLRSWLIRPLVTLERIQDRLDAVEDFAFHGTDRAKPRDALKGMHDLERLISRISLGTAGPRDLTSLRQSLALLPRVRQVASTLSSPLVRSLTAAIDELTDVHDAIAAAIVDEPPALARDGGMICDGADTALDELRAISRGGKTAIAAMEEAERARTGVSSLKIRYNRVFGYYIEVTKSNLAAVPSDYYIRKQNNRRRRALHHAGAQGIRGQRPHARRAHSCARARALRGVAQQSRCRSHARARISACHCEPRRARGAGRDRVDQQLHQAARP